MATADCIGELNIAKELAAMERMTVGELVAFNSYVMLLSQPAQRVGWIVNMLGEAQASAIRLYEILDEPIAIADAPIPACRAAT